MVWSGMGSGSLVSVWWSGGRSGGITEFLHLLQNRYSQFWAAHNLRRSQSAVTTTSKNVLPTPGLQRSHYWKLLSDNDAYTHTHDAHDARITHMTHIAYLTHTVRIAHVLDSQVYIYTLTHVGAVIWTRRASAVHPTHSIHTKHAQVEQINHSLIPVRAT